MGRRSGAGAGTEARRKGSVAGRGAAAARALAVAAALLAGGACGGGSGGGGKAAAPAGGSAGGGAGSAPAAAFAVAVETPADIESGHVELFYRLLDPAGRPADLEVHVSLDGGASWQPATEGLGSDGTRGLVSAPAPGARHLFVWNSFADLGEVVAPAVIARLQVRSASGSARASTGPFALVNGRPGNAVALARGPYVQSVEPTAAAIVWTTTLATTGAVEYGETPALGQVALAQGSRGGTEHLARLSGLRPGTHYHYRVSAGGAPLSGLHRFRSANAPYQPSFTFLVFGDSGKGNQGQWDVAQGMERAGADFALHVGDIVYPDGEQALYDARFFSPYRKLLAQTPIFPAMGNHDVKELFGQAFVDNFVLPDASGSERFYTFHYGDAQFFCLDSSYPWLLTPGLPQHQWFVDELVRSAARWKFVYFHHPPYSSGGHGSDTFLRSVLGPLIEQHGVDVVFTGHDHHYERTTPRQDFVRRPGGRGTVYVVTGAAGALTGSARPPASFTAAKAEELHYTFVRIDGNLLVAEARRPDGSVIDRFDLLK
ncbi:MAG: hypothetical protein KatS3mg102_0020 [Planctomycetota bacterium]|nr:MAG: hypothetical protein KatS3mg102_0020 [Planctomycetota bacterium]